jgi:hypothetical protein
MGVLGCADCHMSRTILLKYYSDGAMLARPGNKGSEELTRIDKS